MNRASPPEQSDAAESTRLGRLVRLEFRRALRPPYVAPSVVVTNGLLMTAAWFLLPTRWQDALFSLHGTFAFALVLASWMYADVPATNVLGLGAHRSLEALDDPVALGRLLNARDIVLWMLVTPICVLVALGIGIYETQWTRMVVTVVTIIVPPFGALGVAAWLGVRFPYHPISLAERWRQRRSWRHMWVRWLALVLLPYVIVPTLAVVALLPSYALWTVTGNGQYAPLDDLRLAAGGLLALVVSLAMWRFGRRGSLRLVRRHAEYLKSYLADPSRG